MRSSKEGLKDTFWYKFFFFYFPDQTLEFDLKSISVCFYSSVVESFRTHESSWQKSVCVKDENGSLWNALLLQYHLHQISHVVFLVFLNPGHQYFRKTKHSIATFGVLFQIF